MSNLSGALNIQGTSTRDVSLGYDTVPQALFIEGTDGKATFAGDVYLNNTSSAVLTIGDISDTDSMSFFTNNGDTFTMQQDVAGAKTQLETDQFIIKKVGGSENIAIFAADAGVKLYYNASKKFETTDEGAMMAGSNLYLKDGSNIRLETSITTNSETSGTIINFGSTSVTAGYYYVLNSSSGWDDTQADAESTSKGLIAIARATGTANNVGMLLEGIYKDASHGFTIGAPLYLSAADNNLVTTTAPSGSSEVVRVMGYAIDANHIYFKPDNTWVKID